MYSIVLVGVDDTPRATHVLDAACEIAERFDSRIHLFRAVRVPQAFPPAAATERDTLPEALESAARRDLEALAAGRPRITIEPPDLITPNPWEAIVGAAQRLGATLIVVGSHGFGGWDHVLGTNAGKVADRATCNVLVVHPQS